MPKRHIYFKDFGGLYGYSIPFASATAEQQRLAREGQISCKNLADIATRRDCSPDPCSRLLFTLKKLSWQGAKDPDNFFLYHTDPEFGPPKPMPSLASRKV